MNAYTTQDNKILSEATLDLISFEVGLMINKMTNNGGLRT